MQADTIRKICLENSSEDAAKQFSKMCKDRIEDLKSSLNTFALQIADDEPQNRPHYMGPMSELIKGYLPKLSASEIVEGFDRTLVEEGTKLNKRNRRLARLLCYLVASKSGLFRNNTTVVLSVVGKILEMMETSEWMRTAACAIICEICETNVPNQDQFLDDFAPKLAALKEDVPSNCNSLYMWLRLKNFYPKLNLGDWTDNVLSKTWLTQFEALLEETFHMLPVLHPLWSLLAEHGAQTLIRHVAELWIQDKRHRYIISMAVTGAIPFLADEEIISDVLMNSAVFETALSIKNSSKFTETLGERLKDMISRDDETAVRVIKCMLDIPGEHSFVTSFLNTVACELPDDKFRQFVEMEMSFKALDKLLWIQKHRQSTDGDVISALFDAACAAAKGEENKIALSKFIGLPGNMQKICSDGHSWFYHISGVELPRNEDAESIESLITVTNETIVGMNTVSEKMKITPSNFGPCSFEDGMSAFIDFVKVLNKSKYDHWHSISRILMRQALSFLDASNLEILFKEPLLLALAVQNRALASVALPMYVEHIEKLPKSFWQDFDENEKIHFPITAEQAAEILPNVMTRCNGKSKFGYQEKVAAALFEKLDDDRTADIIKKHINKILNDTKGTVGGSEVISALCKQSPQIAFDVISHIGNKEVAATADRPGPQKKIQQWISDCCESSEVPAVSIADAIYAALDHEYPATAAGKKKAELALTWAQKLIKKLTREIPRDKFADLADQIIASGSRVASTIIRQISNVAVEE